MSMINSIKEKIEEIRNSDFKVGEIEYYGKKHKIINLFRSALICKNKIDSIENISEEEKKELYEELYEILKNKLKKLNPKFSEKTLNNMVSGCGRGCIIYPMDIFIIDDAVFHKEGIYDDFGSIYKIKTFMFNMKSYYEVSDMYFSSEDFDILPGCKEQLTKEENIYTSKFISDNINLIYGKNITKPIYEFNTDTVFCGYRGLVSDKRSGEKVYINMKFDDIGRSLKSRNELDIKLCIQNGDDIILYYVHQSIKDGEPVWSIVKTDTEIWRLTEEVLKLKNKSTNTMPKLTKTKKY